MRGLRAIAWIVLGLALAGCGTSRWAMDDPDYAAKYLRPYEPGEKIPRMAKQAVDARYVEGKGGLYLGAAVADEPVSVGGDLGVFYYPYSWAEGHIGLSGLAGTGAEDLFLGVNTGVRFQTPTRLAPFAGLGLFGGYSEDEHPADHVWVDSEGYLRSTDTDYGFLGAVYPEVGIHYWLTSKVRLTGSGAYYITTEGRDADFWFVGLGLGFLTGP